MQRSVTTTCLEMTDRAQLRPARPASVDFQLLRAEIPCPELNRFLYTAVGADWWWHTRLLVGLRSMAATPTVPNSRPGLPTKRNPGWLFRTRASRRRQRGDCLFR